jgi:bacteriocin biosynthesis cyclodehydratase domain-containing protein
MANQSDHYQPVSILSVGPFGRCVAYYLRTFHKDLRETVIVGDSLPDPETWSRSRVNVIVSGRPIPHLCELLDRFSFEHRQPFIPVVVDSGFLRVGPIVISGESCWSCWARRLRQHSDWPLEHSALTQHYSTHLDDGPRGYLEPFALIAAAQIAKNVRALDRSAGLPGYVWQIDIIRRNITTSRVVGIHDCVRCGLHREASTRNYLDMRAALNYLWIGSERMSE